MVTEKITEEDVCNLILEDPFFPISNMKLGIKKIDSEMTEDKKKKIIAMLGRGEAAMLKAL